MKTKMFLSLLLLATVVPGALAAGDATETKAPSRRDSVVVIPVEDPAVTNVPTNTAIVPNDPKQVLQDYDSLMIALTQKFSATLAAIAEAVKRGDLSSEQAREMSAEQYQLTHMQFELLSFWRGIEEQDLARIPEVGAEPDSTQENEVVMVALPFSSFQLNPSLAAYLSLTPSQVEAIQQVMMREQHSLEPLMMELRTTREKLLAIGSEHLNEKQVQALADKEASLLARLIVTNARMQSTEGDVSTELLRLRDASDFFVRTSAARSLGGLRNSRAMDGASQRQMAAALSFLRRFPDGHQPKAPERLVILLPA